MDYQTQEDWEKVKEELEKAGQTDTAFYRRAVAISLGLPDPLLTSKDWRIPMKKPQ